MAYSAKSKYDCNKCETKYVLNDPNSDNTQVYEIFVCLVSLSSKSTNFQSCRDGLTFVELIHKSGVSPPAARQESAALRTNIKDKCG